MNLQDRFRRWWSPAQWADDHPSEATENRQGENKHWWQGGGWFFRFRVDDRGSDYSRDSLAPDIERDFKKPR